MSNKNYVIRRKIVQIKPTPIPESMYTPETFVQKVPPPKIVAAPQFEKLAQPHIPPKPNDDLPPIPKFQNPPPDFAPVDFRVNATCLHRDIYLMKSNEEKEAYEKAHEPTQFFEWQQKMRDLDEQQKKEIVLQRHADLDHARRNAMKAKKKIIANRLEMGNKMRISFGKDIQKVQDEIAIEREAIKDLKAQLVDRAPRAVAKVKRQKIEQTKEMKKMLRGELREAQKIKAAETAEIKKKAEKVRSDVENHVMIHGDKFTAKVEITDTKFLAALTDEEATELINEHEEQKKKKIEEQIELHRELKANKMDKLVQMLEEATKERDIREEEHVRKRKEKIETAEKVRLEKEEEEQQKILLLEKKLEKKRNARIKEAEDMEEHTRQIAARNRYLALNKKALATKVFQSQQDAKLRSAKERQTLKMPIEQLKAQKQKPRQSAADLVNLKGLLGI